MGPESSNSKFTTVTMLLVLALSLSSSLLNWAPSFCWLSSVLFAWPSWLVLAEQESRPDGPQAADSGLVRCGNLRH